MMIAVTVLFFSLMSVLGSIPETLGVIAAGAFLVIATVIARRIGSRNGTGTNTEMQHLTESN
jgi:hypothetical protein